GVGVDPLQILDQEHEWLAPRLRRDESKICFERALTSGRGIEPPERVPVLESAELPQDGRHELGKLRIEGGHRRTDFLANRLDGVPTFEAEVASDDVETDTVAGGPRERLRGRVENDRALRPAHACELVHETRLSDAWLSPHRHEQARALTDDVQRAGQLRKLGSSPRERRHGASGRIGPTR